MNVASSGLPDYLQNISEDSVLAVDIFSKVYQYGTSTFDAVDLALEAANVGNPGSLGAPGGNVSWCHIVNLRKASWLDGQGSLGVLKMASAMSLLRKV
jgi:hypothetical protein